MWGRQTIRQPMGFGAGGPVPRDLLLLLGVLLFTYSLQFFGPTRPLVQLLELSPALWYQGQIWQLATYAFVGQPEHGLWFLLTLIILFFFGRDVYRALGRRHFWRVLMWGVVTASGAAAVIAFLLSLIGLQPQLSFVLMQGDTILMTIFIAAFATLYGHATILLFFVLPVQARHFLWLEILIAFLFFLPTGDFPGFLGICVAVGTTYSMLTAGGPQRVFGNLGLRFKRLIFQVRLRAAQRRNRRRLRKTGYSGKGNGGGGSGGNVHRGPWVN